VSSTTPGRSRIDDARIARFLGGLLRAGVLGAAGVVLAGGVLYVARHGGEPAYYGVFRGEPNELRELGAIARAAREGLARAIIQLGILLLVATPIARVASSLVGFALERDGLYVALTCFVLALLLFGLSGGFG